MDLLSKIYKLKKLFDTGKIPRLHHHELHPKLPLNSRENYLYFTLPVALNFQRSSPAMWQAAYATYNDTEVRYLFFPEQVVHQKYTKVQADLVKHKLALQRNKHTDIWWKLSHTLHKYYDDDPRQIIAQGTNDVAAIKNLIQVQRKKDFPYLSGSKMCNYWLYILLQFTDMKLYNLHQISIIPDTHVLQCSVKLGIASPKDSREKVAEKWFELLAKTDLIPIDMHAVLWNWSRNNFLPELI